MSQSGQYLCINSPGDYYYVAPSTVIFNCKDCSYRVYDFPATYNTTLTDGRFLVLGSAFSYVSYDYDYSINTIDPASGKVSEGYVLPDGTVCSTFTSDILSMQAPYCVYQNPYTGHLYATDAKSYASAGSVFEYDPKGNRISQMKCYINPGHMLAIPDRCYHNSKR